MLRLLVTIAASFFFVACGSSNSGAASPPPTAALSGTLLGQPFTPADAAALLPGQGSCTLSGVTASATGLAIRFSSFPGLCSLMSSQNRTCGTRANSTVLTLLVLSTKLGGSAAPVQPGTYRVATLPQPGPQGSALAEGFAARTAAACTTTPSATVAETGTITIETVGSTVTGSADVTFSDGGHVAGTFSAPVCSLQVDVCTVLADLAQSCVAQSCVP